jgi:hypothetical protein
MRRAYQVALLVLSLAAGGCAGPDFDKPATYARGDDNEFTNVVMPVLARDCGFQACHGSSERFFRIYGVGRQRLPIDPTAACENDSMPPCYYNDLNGNERDYSLQIAQSFVDPANPNESLLLRKPLAVEAGGSDHSGVDKYGRNVYRTPDDQGFLVIQRWVFNVATKMAYVGGTSTGQAGAPSTAAVNPPATPIGP